MSCLQTLGGRSQRGCRCCRRIGCAHGEVYWHFAHYENILVNKQSAYCFCWNEFVNKFVIHEFYGAFWCWCWDVSLKTFHWSFHATFFPFLKKPGFAIFVIINWQIDGNWWKWRTQNGLFQGLFCFLNFEKIPNRFSVIAIYNRQKIRDRTVYQLFSHNL